MTLGLLDIYILSLLDRGIETPYALQREAGLSLGASTPSLRRLCDGRFVKRHDGIGATNRPRHVYTLTTSGRELARNSWKEHLDASRLPTDLDGVLRLAEMARHYGVNSGKVADLLKQASERRKLLAKQAAATAGRTGQPISYQDMRSKCEAARLRAEADALIQLAAGVEGERHSVTRASFTGATRRAPRAKKPK